MSEVRKRKRQFEIGFKRQVVQEVESGSISLSAAGRKYELSPGLINLWRDKLRGGALSDAPTKRERELEKAHVQFRRKTVLGQLIFLGEFKKFEPVLKKCRQI